MSDVMTALSYLRHASRSRPLRGQAPDITVLRRPRSAPGRDDRPRERQGTPIDHRRWLSRRGSGPAACRCLRASAFRAAALRGALRITPTDLALRGFELSLLIDVKHGPGGRITVAWAPKCSGPHQRENENVDARVSALRRTWINVYAKARPGARTACNVSVLRAADWRLGSGRTRGASVCRRATRFSRRSGRSGACHSGDRRRRCHRLHPVETCSTRGEMRRAPA